MGVIHRAEPEGGKPNDIPAVAMVLPTSLTGTDLLVRITDTVVSHDPDEYHPWLPTNDSGLECAPLADGSLICSSLSKDLLHVHATLAICSALLVFFFRNTFTVLRYVHSGKVPQKALFYVLLGSQVIGLASPLPIIISIFSNRVDCRLVEVASTMANFLSLSLLVTGVLGVKAYRCLDSSNVVLAGLVLLRTAGVILIVLDAINLGVGRGLAGACIRSPPMTYLAGTAIAQLGELLFISCCFAWGFWKANWLRPGRLTVPSTPTLPDIPRHRVSEDSRRRGWWDYIPDDRNHPTETPEIAASEGTHNVFDGSVWRSSSLTKHRESLPSTAHTLPQREFDHRPRLTSRLSTYAFSVTASSLVSKFGLQIKNLFRNELASTSGITLLQGVTTVLAVVNMNSGSFSPVYCLSIITWVAISQLLLLTFDRVIRRHEKEAVWQNSHFWEPARREVREVFRVPTTRESSLLGSSNLTFPDNVTYRSEKAASSIVSDPFNSRRSSWSSGYHPEQGLSSTLDPMLEGPGLGRRLSTVSSYLLPHDSLPPSPTPSSSRSTIRSSTHILAGRCGGNG